MNFMYRIYKEIFCRGERELGNWIQNDLGFRIIRHERNIIKPYEIDIYIPSKNMAIDYNLTNWKQDSNKTNEKYKLCDSKGIILISIQDNQWKETKDEVMSLLYNVLKYSYTK